MYPALRDDHLRYLEKWGLIRPVAGRYSFADLHVVRQAAGELERGVSLGTRPARAGVGATAASWRSTSSRAAIRARARARRVAADGAAGDRRCFRRARRSRCVEANHALAAKYFLEGAELDDGEERNLDAAAAAYRRALLFDPQLVPALVNLANIHYERDELVEAEALYEKAMRVDAECFEAYFNLGNIHHDLARYPEACQRVSRRAGDQSRLPRGALLPGGDAREARPLGRSEAALEAVPRARAGRGVRGAGEGVLGLAKMTPGVVLRKT